MAIGVQVQGGVYASGSLSVGGTVSHTESSCDGQTCTEAELGVSGSIGPVGRISGSVCYAQGGALLADLSACAALVGEVGGSASGKGSVSGSTCTGFNGGFCFEGLSASISISGEITYQGIKYSESISFTTPKVLGNCNG